MPSKPSGEIKVRTIKSKQKNGDIYILERRTIYDTEKKYNKVLSTKLISKIPKGSELPVHTRPKKESRKSVPEKAKDLSAVRKHIGMMDIIDHIGNISGIDAAIYTAADKGTAQKILSIARYLLATNGQSLPGIQTWQYNHPLPYEDGISEDIYHNLFVKIGRDETLQQSFFASRLKNIDEKDAIAYDSTTISTYSNKQIEARYGYNKAGDGLKSIKLLTLYSIDKRQPIAFTKQSGNLADVVTIANAVKQLSALGVKTTEIVTDNGYYSEQNLSELFQAGFDFITLVKTNLKWVKPEIDKHIEEFKGISSVCPFDTNIHGISVKLTHDFKKVRKYANCKKGIQKGDTETFCRRIYLNIYFNAARQAEDKAAFEQDLLELKQLIEAGTAIEELSERAQHKVSKYLLIKKYAGKLHISFNNKACEEAYKYHGYFALVSNKEKEPFECLRKYRKRETIESFFEAGKQHTDGQRIRVWDTDTLRGRMFVQFVSLCYYEYLSEELRKLKQNLGKNNEDTKDKTKETIDAENKLRSWLENTPLYLQLQWFDTVERVEISNKLTSKRWRTEITSRDNLYLEKLGINTD